MFRRFRNYPQIGGKRGAIPADCVEVQYLESTGTQYIDTGVYFCISDSRSPKIRFDYAMTQKDSSTPRLLGYVNSPALMQVYYDSGSDTIRWQPLPNTTTIYSTGYAWDANRHSTVVDFTTSAITISEDGETLATGICKRINISSRPMYLFARNNNGAAANFASYQLYGFSYDDGVQKLNLVPVRRTTDGLGYMCDTLTGTLYGNAGTGAFVIGPDKWLPYDAEVEWIRRPSGGAVVQWYTPFKPENDDVIEWRARILEGTGNYTSCGFVSYVKDGIECTRVIKAGSSTSNAYVYFRRNATQANTVAVNLLGVHDYALSLRKIVVDGKATTISGVSGLSESRGAYRVLYSAGSEIHWFKVTRGGVPLIDLKPVRFRDANGVTKGAFYDSVSKTLITQTGDGPYEIGPDK